ncbi:hypothetical protein F5146DRAFT_1145771 [Armillaria mellea]|nr:hypothetical protein F5146DRAFT_1145771 [Armillaria mellea]
MLFLLYLLVLYSSNLVKLSYSQLTRRLRQMAESTDPNKVAALKAYDGASHAISELQDNLPDVDDEGSVDAWVTKAHQHWQIAVKNWKSAGVLDESGLQTAMLEYNALAERAMEFDFDVVPLPVPKLQKRSSVSSGQRQGSHLASSPIQSRSSSNVPTADPSIMPPPSVLQSKNPSRSSFGLSFGLANSGAAATMSRSPLFAINAKDRLHPALGPQLPDDEEDNDNLASILPGGDEVSEAEASLQDIVATITSPLLAKAPSRSKPHLLTTKTAFIFDADTGELMLTPLSSFLDPQLPNLKTALLDVTQPKKDQKASKSKFQDSEVAAPRKHGREDDEGAAKTGKHSSKKPRLQLVEEISDDEPVVATKVVRKRGPGLSKLPPISLGVSGGGSGEHVPKVFQPVNDGIKSIGVLVVEEDLGDFIKVDGRLWNKQVAPFVGERYSTPCDQCKSHRMQCRKLLGHMVICVRCHYAKQPCTVDGVPALSPVDQYRPQGSHDINAFASALNTLEQNNQAITSLTQQYMTGLNILAHVESSQVQVSRLRTCLPSDEDSVDNSDGADNEDDEVAKGKAGPSKKKSKSS